jgi:hypothetical protein
MKEHVPNEWFCGIFSTVPYFKLRNENMKTRPPRPGLLFPYKSLK